MFCIPFCLRSEIALLSTSFLFSLLAKRIILKMLAKLESEDGNKKHRQDFFLRMGGGGGAILVVGPGNHESNCTRATD